MFVVVRVDSYDEYEGIEEIVGCFESRKNAQEKADYMNLCIIYNKIKDLLGTSDVEYFVA